MAAALLLIAWWTLCGLAAGGERDYLVSYKKFLSQQERSALLATNSSLWVLKPRSNEASRFPSDFDVLEISDDVLSKARESILSIPLVKSLHEDRRYTRKLKGLQEDSRSCSHTGRKLTKWSWENNTEEWPSERHSGERKLLRALPEESVTDALQADELWRLGFSGQGVRVGIFDTGLKEGHSHFKNVRARTDWTDEHTLDDGIGHGTFVAGIVASSSSQCHGFAPDADLFIFRVFTNKQVSFTSWFLDALNFAIFSQIDVINLSIGGPDFQDTPFVEKVNELTASNVILVSAIGNDGPLFGTLNNPADMNNIIGVGGITPEEKVAPFSSRGMTLWEIPGGMGRFKPDIVTYSTNIRGSHFHHGCRSLSGTSVASPVVTGAVTLLSSVIPMEQRRRLVNPASIKQVLMETAQILPLGGGIFEQGQGRVDLPAAASLLSQYAPRASIVPPRLDTTDCPYMWPFCEQPLFYAGLPLMVNLTVLNGMAAMGWIGKPSWFPETSKAAMMIDVAFEYPDVVWPWSSFFALRVSVRAAASHFRGTVGGHVIFNVTSPALPGSTQLQSSTIVLPVKFAIVPTPDRKYRLLWDQFHSLSYPSGFFPRDSLRDTADPLDWHGDHPFTNFRSTFTALRKAGYFIDVLGQPFTCFDASLYGTLLIVDSEEEFFQEEIDKLDNDVNKLGLNVIVFADWYSVSTMSSLKFFDENTHNWWYPETGGSNIPALNRLLSRWGFSFAEGAYSGDYSLEEHAASYISGSVLAAAPAGSHVISALLRDDQTEGGRAELLPIIGLGSRGAARVAVYGDSGCLDDASRIPEPQRCEWLLQLLLRFAHDGEVPPLLLSVANKLDADTTFSSALPKAAPESTLHLYSHVLQGPAEQRPLPLCTRIQWASAKVLPSELVAVVRDREERMGNRTRVAVAKHPRSQADDTITLLLLFIAIVVLFVVGMLWWLRRLRRR